jgi:hypothetical protein
MRSSVARLAPVELRGFADSSRDEGACVERCLPWCSVPSGWRGQDMSQKIRAGRTFLRAASSSTAAPPAAAAAAGSGNYLLCGYVQGDFSTFASAELRGVVAPEAGVPATPRAPGRHRPARSAPAELHGPRKSSPIGGIDDCRASARVLRFRRGADGSGSHARATLARDGARHESRRASLRGCAEQHGLRR